MKWDKYEKSFLRFAKKRNIKQDKIDECLRYARNLFDKNLPIVYDLQHFAFLCGISANYIAGASNSPRLYYRTYKIPKRAGGTREINEPLPTLKYIQKWINDNILSPLEVSKYAKAYIKNRSIRDNARFHNKQETVLTVDIEDFFGTISFPMVYSVFKRQGYSKGVSTLFANLCSLNNRLPQGAPTSPSLSNLVALKLDNRIAGFIKKHNIRYTRYSDDLTFSGKFKVGFVVNFVRDIMRNEGFALNEKKTRTMSSHQRQEVTGVVVNEIIQTPKDLRRKLRQDIYFIKKFGLASHLMHTKNTRANAVKHLLGVANHISFINPKDLEVKEYMVELKKLLTYERERGA